MKKIIVFKIILLSCMFSYSQEFKMKLWFQDAVGNKDSIELGYDLLATDSIDSQFGETNIITTPWSNNFEVRISNEWKNRFNNNQSGTYHTKKQIVKKQLCSIPHSVTAIDIKAQHWPVTVSWDSTLNFTDCYNSSLLTSVMPYGWWDTPGFISLFANSSKKTFMPNELYFNNYYKYISNNNDTLDVVWQIFGDNSSIFLGVFEEMVNNSNLRIVPNPVTGTFIIHSKNTNSDFVNINVFSIDGKMLKHFKRDQVFDISDLPNGMFLIQIEMSNKEFIFKKIIKNN